MHINIIVCMALAASILSVIGLGMFISDVFLRDRIRWKNRLAEAFRDEMQQRARESPLFKDRQDGIVSSGVRKYAPWETWQSIIHQAGLSVHWQHIAMAMPAISAVGGVVIWIGTRSRVFGLLGALLLLPVPVIYIIWRRRQRISELANQLPEAFDFMARALRAGQMLPAAFQMVATTFRPPVAEEFSYCYEQQHLGVSQEDTLRELARRVEIMELKIFAVALIVQGRAGGNLAELLTKLAVMIRQRIRFKQRVRSLTSEGRMQALVLIVLPPVVFAALCVLNPKYAYVLFDHPHLLYGAVASQLIGAACIQRIIRIDY